MVCIYCAGPTQVINTRHQARQNNIWRRRQCLTCRAIFTSHELADLSTAVVVSSSGYPSKLAPFCREKLFVSLFQACGHRPQPLADAVALTQTVVAKIPISEKGVVLVDDLVHTAHKVLDRFDKVAATHYAAYHPTTGATS